MSAADRRTLVLDDSLDHRLVPELAARGRPATSVAELDLRGAGDAELLDTLGRALAAWVLVTADDARGARPPRRAARHSTARWRSSRPTTISSRSRREVVHRWAHAMQAQDAGSAAPVRPDAPGRVAPSDARLGSEPERQGPGGPSGLQNRQGVVARRLEGSIPSPLRRAQRPAIGAFSDCRTSWAGHGAFGANGKSRRLAQIDYRADYRAPLRDPAAGIRPRSPWGRPTHV